MSTQPSDESLSRRLVRLDNQIKLEFDLIGLRVSWLLVSNSFLFAAYVVALNNTSAIELNISLIHILIWALPVIGLVSSFLVSLAIIAANEVVSELKVLRDKVEDEASRLYSYEKLGVHVKSWSHVVGNWPPKLLPPLLIFVWAALLYSTAKG